MQATRLIVETNEHGQIVNLPPLFPGVRMEAIFLVLDEPPSGAATPDLFEREELWS